MAGRYAGSCWTLVLSLVIFQTKTFFFQGQSVLIALSSRGPFIAFGGELEVFPGFSPEELTPNAEWSIYTCLAILYGDMICIGNCLGQVCLFRLESCSKEGLVHSQYLATTTRSKVQLLAADMSLLVAADSAGKIWSWLLDKETLVPVFKGLPTGLSHLLNCLELTATFIALGFSNGTLRLMFRDSGSVYCDATAHAASLTAMAYSPASQILVTVGEDSFIRAWTLDEKNEECKVKHLQDEVVEDIMLCGVQFLNSEGTRFGAVGYDRNEMMTYTNA